MCDAAELERYADLMMQSGQCWLLLHAEPVCLTVAPLTLQKVTQEVARTHAHTHITHTVWAKPSQNSNRGLSLLM